MNLLEGIRLSLDGLRTNKLRSALTMLGVVIGVVSVVLLVSISLSVRAEITGSIKGLGSNIYVILSGAAPGPVGRTVVNRLRIKHALELSKRSDYNILVCPTVNKVAPIKYRERKRYTTIVSGVFPNLPTVRDWKVSEGSFLKKTDLDAGRRVCVIGKTVKGELFRGIDPLGRYLMIGNKKFKIIGIMEGKGLLLDLDMDDQVFIPLTTAQRLFGVEELSFILVHVPRAREIPLSMKQSERILSQFIEPSDFMIRSQGETLEVLHHITSILTIMLGSIAAISLVVGGIGIMNIMTVSVKERTKEIGILKAVGAKETDILMQFLGEAVIISFLGGLIGIGISFLLAYGIGILYPVFKLAISILAIGVALLFAISMGTFFGVYPAWKAAILDPIEALRYE